MLLLFEFARNIWNPLVICLFQKKWEARSNVQLISPLYSRQVETCLCRMNHVSDLFEREPNKSVRWHFRTVLEQLNDFNILAKWNGKWHWEVASILVAAQTFPIVLTSPLPPPVTLFLTRASWSSRSDIGFSLYSRLLNIKHRLFYQKYVETQTKFIEVVFRGLIRFSIYGSRRSTTKFSLANITKELGIQQEWIYIYI